MLIQGVRAANTKRVGRRTQGLEPGSLRHLRRRTTFVARLEHVVRPRRMTPVATHAASRVHRARRSRTRLTYEWVVLGSVQFGQLTWPWRSSSIAQGGRDNHGTLDDATRRVGVRRDVDAHAVGAQPFVAQSLTSPPLWHAELRSLPARRVRFHLSVAGAAMTTRMSAFRLF